MLCQNCGKNEATTHIKQIINGDMAESHICSECAAHLGYGDMFSGFGLNFSDLLGSFFGDMIPTLSAGNVTRCKKCGSSFDDIVRDGRVGCADCYRTFFDKLLPSLQRIHGKVQHSGKVSTFSNSPVAEQNPAEQTKEEKIGELKEKMNEAVACQNFELAAKIRDEIKELEGGENK